MAFVNRYSLRISLFLTLCVLASVSVAWAADESETLRQLRAERRTAAAERNLSADKGDTPGQFGLLVIPVDFSDTRLPDHWDSQALLQKLVPDSGETLHNYFRIASAELLDLQITLAPLIHLPETRRLYSDRDLNGFTRTRKLATESIAAVRDMGLDLRRLDTDGPDGISGTGDDDGQVDGVLILHAGLGNENDPDEGLIQALQFFLEEPVEANGVSASFYAVASLHSGPGIWAHETAHLLGLEDRYDPILPAAGASEVHSVGGLGRFSLMSSGAWGTGGGYGAAMPDAYSATQMGWRPLRNLVTTNDGQDTVAYGEAARVWTRGEPGPEFFLLETRDPVASAPFDAAVPGGQLLIYHIDENISEGNWHEDGPYQWHLRARLVEADADPDESLALGHNDGRAEDLFPGPLNVTEFGPFTIPSSRSYQSGSSEISLTGITPSSTGVHFGYALGTTQSVAFEYDFEPIDDQHLLNLTVRETGAPIGTMRCEIRVSSTPTHGYFVDTGLIVADFALVEQQPGLWQPADAVWWNLFPDLIDDAQTEYRFRFYNATITYGTESRWWAWRTTGQVLDFSGAWPGDWTIAHPGLIDHPAGNTETTWHRWAAAPWLTADQNSVLACTGTEFTTGANWPNVTYQNEAYTTLTSAPLGGTVTGVRLTHAIEVEMLTATTAMDGGIVQWVGPDGVAEAAAPLENYGGVIASKSVNPLHGQTAFVSADLALDGDIPLWRTDTFAVPTTGPGPWRLRLVFGANRLWRARGWFIADIEAITGLATVTGFVPDWDGDLHWTWPWTGAGDPHFAVQTRTDDLSPWVQILDGLFEPVGPQQYSVPGSQITRSLGLSNNHRHQVRVVGQRPAGEVASSAVVVYPDGGDGQAVLLSDPWPNPFHDTVRFLLDVPAGKIGILKVYDLRGRLLATSQYGPGQQLALWDGRTDAGAALASGVYYLRLEGTGSVLTRKVVLIH